MKKILSITLLLMTFTALSQVTVSIENLEANDVSVPNGSSIELGTDSSINVTFRVDLSKEDEFIIGPAKVYIDVVDNLGNRTEKRNRDVPESVFVESASAPFDFDIDDTDIRFGDGNYLVAVLKQNNPPGVEWTSQQIPINKTPTFVLEPSSINIPCGDTSPQTFTVSNNSNLSGVTYQ